MAPPSQGLEPPINPVRFRVIIVGVADGTFERQGLTEANISTYNIDIMRDQVSPYADPYVDFRVSFPKDSDGKTFAVIEVSPFAEVPVICGRSMQDVKEGDIYYRSSDRRPQSARISNSHDIRDLIERAIVQRRNKLVQIGLVQQEANVADALDAELGGL